MNLAVFASAVVYLIEREILNPVCHIDGSSEDNEYSIVLFAVAHIAHCLGQFVLNIHEIFKPRKALTGLTAPLCDLSLCAVTYNRVPLEFLRYLSIVGYSRCSNQKQEHNKAYLLQTTHH